MVVVTLATLGGVERRLFKHEAYDEYEGSNGDTGR